MNALLVALGIAVAGGAGAATRHLVDTSVPDRLRARFPWGIMIINLSGSFVLGIVTGLSLDHAVASVIATGFLGGYTTFSTASLDSARLLLARRYGAALWNGPGMLLLSVALSITGILLAR